MPVKRKEEAKHGLDASDTHSSVGGPGPRSLHVAPSRAHDFPPMPTYHQNHLTPPPFGRVIGLGIFLREDGRSTRAGLLELFREWSTCS